MYRQYEIRFDAPATWPVGGSPSDSALIDSIAWLMRNRLDLPFPSGIKAYVYVNQGTFVEGLVKIAGETSEDAWEQRFSWGSATRVGLFLRGDYLARMNLVGRASLFAHELTHVSQNRLREGGRVRPAQWILEGHAEWVKFKVVDLLGYRAYVESRDITMRRPRVDDRVLPRPGGARQQRGLARGDASARRFPISDRQFADEFRARLEGLSLPTRPASRGS